MQRAWLSALVLVALPFSGVGCEDDSPAGSGNGEPNLGIDAGNGSLDAAPRDGSTRDPDGGSTDAGPDAGPPEVIGAYVSCGSGLDTNNGEDGSPLKTLAKAATVATAGTTIVVLDGTCSKDTEPAFNQASGKVTLPDGVSIRAANAGSVTFTGVNGYRSAGIEFAGSGRIAGIHFETFGIAIQASDGEVVVEDVSWNDVGAGFPIQARGTAKVTLKPGRLTNYIGANQGHMAQAEDTAEITVLGGTVRGAKDTGVSGQAQFMALGSSKIVLDGVTLVDSLFSGAGAHQSATIIVRNKSVIDNVSSKACCNGAAINASGTSRVEVIDSTIKRTPLGSIVLTSGTPTLVLDQATIEDGAGWAVVAEIYSNALPAITVKNQTRLARNGGGLFLNYKTNLDVSDSFIVDNGSPTTQCGHGIHLNGAAGDANVMKIRRTSITGNCGSGIDITGGSDASDYDFGTKASPGQNTISGNNATAQAGRSNISLSSAAALTVKAVGNTWNPGHGANPSGKYTVPMGQTVLEVTGAVSNANHIISGNTAKKLRLAEN